MRYYSWFVLGVLGVLNLTGPAFAGILVVDPNAFSDPFGASGAVIRVDPVTGAQTTVFSGGSFLQPVGIALDAAGNILVTDQQAFGSAAVFRVDPVTGAQTTVSSGGRFVRPSDLVVEPMAATAVPEPGTLALALIAAAGLGLSVARRRRA